MEKDRDGYLTDPEWRGVETGIVCPTENAERVRWLERFVRFEPALCLRMQYGRAPGAFWSYSPVISGGSRAIVWRQPGFRGQEAAERLAGEWREKWGA